VPVADQFIAWDADSTLTTGPDGQNGDRAAIRLFARMKPSDVD